MKSIRFLFERSDALILTLFLLFSDLQPPRLAGFKSAELPNTMVVDLILSVELSSG